MLTFIFQKCISWKLYKTRCRRVLRSTNAPSCLYSATVLWANDNVRSARLSASRIIVWYFASLYRNNWREGYVTWRRKGGKWVKRHFFTNTTASAVQCSAVQCSASYNTNRNKTILTPIDRSDRTGLISPLIFTLSSSEFSSKMGYLSPMATG